MSTVQLAFAALASSVVCSLLVWVISGGRNNVALADHVCSVFIMVSEAATQRLCRARPKPVKEHFQ
jgi:hypothetical protein